MEQEIQQLKERIEKLERALTLSGMPYELKEIIRNEVIKGEDPTVTLTQSYGLGETTVVAAKAYSGVVDFEWKGRIYKIPYISND